MIGAAESDLLKRLRNSPLAKKLSVIDVLPELDGEELIAQFGAAAPALYIAAMPFQLHEGVAIVPFSIGCVVKNARGNQAARQGDGIALGLYELMMLVASELDGTRLGDGNAWTATTVAYMHDAVLTKHQLSVGSVGVQTRLALPDRDGLEELASPFITFHADYDIAPQETSAERAKWAQEPPDHSSSTPDASDDATLEQ